MTSTISYKPNAVVIEAWDLEVDGGAERRGEKEGLRRAVVHGPGDQLVFNWAGDYTGGVRTDSQLEVDGDLSVSGDLDVEQGADIQGNVRVRGSLTLDNAGELGGLIINEPNSTLLVRSGILMMKDKQTAQPLLFSLNPKSLKDWPGGLPESPAGRQLDVLAELKKLRQEVEALKQAPPIELHQLRQELQALRQELEALKQTAPTELRQLRQELHALRQELEALRQATPTEFKKLRQELEALRQEHEALQQNVNALQEAIRQNQGLDTQLRQALEALRQELEPLRKKVEALQETVRQDQDLDVKLRQALEALRQELEALKLSTRPRIVTGVTLPEQWRNNENGTGVMVDVDTSHAGFQKTPTYVTVLYGRGFHWEVSGTNSIYHASPTGFRLYLRWAAGGPMDRSRAIEQDWYLMWAAIEQP